MASLRSNYETRNDCYCGYEMSVQRAWTEDNPGRRFMACPDYDADRNIRGCSYFKWIDKEMTVWQKEVILKLMHEREKLQKDLAKSNRQRDLKEKSWKRARSDMIMMKLRHPHKGCKYGWILNYICLLFVMCWIIFKLLF